MSYRKTRQSVPHVPLRLAAGRHQSGVASIEFAFVFLTLFLMLYGIVTFGSALYTQQVLSRAAEDGARAANLLRNPALEAETVVRSAVLESIARSSIVPPAHTATQGKIDLWIASRFDVRVTPHAATHALRVTVKYNIEDEDRLLPRIPLFDAREWMPQVLRSHASVALRF